MRDASVSSSSGLVSASPAFSDALYARAYGVKLDEPLQESAPVANPRSVQALEAALTMAQIVAKECTKDAIQARQDANESDAVLVWWVLISGCLCAAAVIGWVRWVGEMKNRKLRNTRKQRERIRSAKGGN